MTTARPRRRSPQHEAAIARMRERQRSVRMEAGLGRALFASDQLAAGLKRADARRRRSKVQGTWVRSGFYRYPLATEPLRWARTRRILRRSAPGPDEDGGYLELIARQAASVEMVLCGEHAGEARPKAAQLCERMLLCTLPTQRPAAHQRGEGDYYFVEVNAGLIDFAYQATKAVVLAWKPVPPAPGALFAFRNEPGDIDEVLATGRAPLELLRRTLSRYLFEGVPRVPDSRAPAVNYQAPLGLITSSNERFVVGHEYAHVLHDVHDIAYPGQGAQAEEFGADLLSFGWLAESGDALDCLPPNMALQGAFFVITALEVLRQAQDIARFGQPRPDAGDGGHPPNHQRLAVLREAYLRQVSREDGDLSIRAALAPSRTLEQLWARLQADGVAAVWHGRPLHRIWEGAAAF